MSTLRRIIQEEVAKARLIREETDQLWKALSTLNDELDKLTKAVSMTGTPQFAPIDKKKPGVKTSGAEFNAAKAVTEFTTELKALTAKWKTISSKWKRI